MRHSSIWSILGACIKLQYFQGWHDSCYVRVYVRACFTGMFHGHVLTKLSTVYSFSGFPTNGSYPQTYPQNYRYNSTHGSKRCIVQSRPEPRGFMMYQIQLQCEQAMIEAILNKVEFTVIGYIDGMIHTKIDGQWQVK